MKRYLEIQDQDIIQCISQTNDWYAFGALLDYEFGNINEYKLWIGSLQWGDNDKEDIFACYENSQVYFTCATEKHTDLVSFIIHAWDADEPITLQFNDEIRKTIDLLSNHNEHIHDLFFEYRCHAPYTFHSGAII